MHFASYETFDCLQLNTRYQFLKHQQISVVLLAQLAPLTSSSLILISDAVVSNVSAIIRLLAYKDGWFYCLPGIE